MDAMPFHAHDPETWKTIATDPAADVDYDRNGLESLDRDTCLALLRELPVGRIGISIDALPVILPVNFVLARRDGHHEEVIVLRSGKGTKLGAALRHNVVAFEADGHDVMNHMGWSVLVQGSSRAVDDPEENAWATQLPLRPWAVADTCSYVVVSLDVVSGRRFGVRPPPA